MLTDTRHDTLWWLALFMGLFGIAGWLVSIPVLSTYAFWFVVAGFVLFLVGPELHH